MLNGKQRSYLKKLSNKVNPIFQIGNGCFNDNVIKQFDEALEARELVKATVLKNSLFDAKEACIHIAEATGSEQVLVIGNRFVLYRESKKKKTISLPKK